MVKKHVALTLDEAAVIVLYTMEEIPRENSLYFVLNTALRAKDRKLVKRWRDYIWLLMHALKKLPVASERTVFRGAKLTPAELQLELSDGFEFTWSAFSSTACTQGVMNGFVGDTGSRTLYTLELTEPVARKIVDFSLFPGEDEVLLPPNVSFEIVSNGVFAAGHGLTMVQCKQTETVDQILDLAPSQADAADDGAAEVVSRAGNRRAGSVCPLPRR